MMIFLDFDGVIIDSIEECYQISFETYYAYTKFPFPIDQYKRLFYKYRGIVGPAHQYLSLHRALEEYFLILSEGQVGNVSHLFVEFDRQVSVEEADAFENKFFFIRSLYQNRDFSSWIELNPLTDFGKTLVKQSNENIYIVTTKDRQATQAILNYHQIPVMAIYANDEVKNAGSKGALISELLNKNYETQAVFVDDSVDHLNTVKDNRVNCYFADWGYGENTSYQEYKFQ